MWFWIEGLGWVIYCHSGLCSGRWRVARFHVVEETVFLVDAAAVLALQVAGKGFGLSDPFHTAVPLHILPP